MYDLLSCNSGTGEPPSTYFLIKVKVGQSLDQGKQSPPKGQEGLLGPERALRE